MNLLKIAAAAILIITALILISLPGSPTSNKTLEEYQSLPDFDFRSEAQNLWENEEQEAALLLLEEIIANDWPDKAAAEQLYKSYGEEIEKRNSGLGKIKAFGASFITGKVNSFEELAGASLADFFIYGDIRDLSRELIFEDDSNGFIVSLSTLGLLTTLFPPADPLASLLKTSHKSGALTQAMTSHIVKVLEPLKSGASKVSALTLKNIVAQLKPIWTLAGKCKSWQHFALFMKHAKNTKQVQFIIKVISTPGNSKKLAAVLSTLKSFPKSSADALAFIHKYGQKGMDSLYSLMRKGPKGIQFLLKNPKLYARLAKNAVKTADLSSNMLKKSWEELLRKYGLPINILRYVIAALCLFGIKLLFFRSSKTSLLSKPQTSDKTAEPQVAKNNIYFWISAAVFIILMFFLFSGNSSANAAFQLSAPTQSSAGFSSASIIFFLIFSAVQAWSIYKARMEVEEIYKVSDESKKMKLLENCEFYFDLPVYTGLAGTVCAFILLNFDPSGSRILAYATTVSGIMISIILRGKWLFPMKKQIINGNKHE